MNKCLCVIFKGTLLQMEWFDVELELKVTPSNNSEIGDPSTPYVQGGVMGLMITSSFLDTTYSCSINDVELGNTTLIIYPNYLVVEESKGWSWRRLSDSETFIMTCGSTFDLTTLLPSFIGLMFIALQFLYTVSPCIWQLISLVKHHHI